MPYKDLEVRRAYAREYQKKYELSHKPQRRKSNIEYKQRLRDYVQEYKLAHSCIRCGESDPICLDFHHRDPHLKDINVADAVRIGWGVQRFKDEIDKCDVLCANCHRKVHWEQKMGAGVRFELTTSIRM